jgi:hypothetical protein
MASKIGLFSICQVRVHRHIIPNVYIPIRNHPTRGAFCRTLSNVGWRRRPLLRHVTAGPGGPGQPSAGITTGCPQGLDAAGTKAGGRPPDKGSPKGFPCVPPGSTAPGTEKPQVERRKAARPPSLQVCANCAGLFARGAARRSPQGPRRETGGCAFRCSTPSHSQMEAGAKGSKSGAIFARGNNHARPGNF